MACAQSHMEFRRPPARIYPTMSCIHTRTVRPSINGERGYIASGIEAARPSARESCSRTLSSMVSTSLKSSPRPMRCAREPAGPTCKGVLIIVNHDWFIRFTRAVVSPNADGRSRLKNV